MRGVGVWRTKGISFPLSGEPVQDLSHTRKPLPLKSSLELRSPSLQQREEERERRREGRKEREITNYATT